MLKKAGPVKWTSEAEAALHDLKKYLSSVPTLVAPKPQKPLLLYLAAMYQVVSPALVAQREADNEETTVAEPSFDEITSSLARLDGTYQSGTVEAWYPIYVLMNILDWFDLAYKTFDHRSFVRTLHLILNNKTLYMFVPHSNHDIMYFTCNYDCLFLRYYLLPYEHLVFYICNLSCNCILGIIFMTTKMIQHVIYTYTTRTSCSFCFCHFQLTQSRGRLFLKKGRMMRMILLA